MGLKIYLLVFRSTSVIKYWVLFKPQQCRLDMISMKCVIPPANNRHQCRIVINITRRRHVSSSGPDVCHQKDAQHPLFSPHLNRCERLEMFEEQYTMSNGSRFQCQVDSIHVNASVSIKCGSRQLTRCKRQYATVIRRRNRSQFNILF